MTRADLARGVRSAVRGVARGAGKAGTSVLGRLRRPAPGIEPTDGIARVEGLELAVPDPSKSQLSRRLMEHGVTERDFTDMARVMTRPGDVILDVGASIGYFTILFATWAGPDGRVLAHEPWPSARAYLLHNVGRNRLANVSFDWRALADVDGIGHMSPPTYRLELGPSTDPAAMDVTAARFDAIVDESGVERLDIVKMDIEGAEGRALAGMLETFRRFRPVLLLEVHPDMLPLHGHDVAGIHRFLSDLGYAWLVVEPDADPGSGHHLVAGPPERLAAAGIVPDGERRLVLAPDPSAWAVAPGSPAELSRGPAGVEVRPTAPGKPGYVADGPSWWNRAPAAGLGAADPSAPIWVSWDGSVGPGATGQAWIFEYDGSRLDRRRAFPLPDATAEWRFLSGPSTTAVRLAIEVRGEGAIVIRRLAVEQKSG